ncbi:hypothetical protein [Parvularcula sp. LCG005]|uniref:hypothetical protein n=1 Tax=Parvularcula sp. LCG005 TaxID=3078805 RepID=UPI0029435E86|nr:hypothetical protein [Parvularcula sp. LCG005]WOI53416.1 hypothetical protein RUI03_00130 [Parvularcula sp. LCG005]
MSAFLSAVALFLQPVPHIDPPPDFTQARAVIDGWEMAYVAKAPDGMAVSRTGCGEKEYRYTCRYSVEGSALTLAVAVPIEADEMSVLVLAMKPDKDWAAKKKGMLSIVEAAAPAAMSAMGWTGTPAADQIEDGVDAALPAIGAGLSASNPHVDRGFFAGQLTGDHRGLIATISLRLMADGPHLYDQELADRRTTDRLKRASEALGQSLGEMKNKADPGAAPQAD